MATIAFLVGAVSVLSPVRVGELLRAEIVIQGDGWDGISRTQSVGSLPFVETTDPDAANPQGAKSLVMPTPNQDKFVLFGINVTGLPGGVTRFPVSVTVRNVNANTSSMGLRNLSIDDNPPDLQLSYLAILFTEAAQGTARDELGGEDPFGTVGGTVREDNTRASPEVAPPAVIETLNATLELELGLNLLRIDATDPLDVTTGQPYQPNTGWQVFSLTIGPGEADLQGEIVPVCSVSRALSASRVRPGDPLTVTLDATRISGSTTIADTYPAGWEVAEDGGGAVNAASNTITFNATVDGELTYTLTAPDSCVDPVFSGTVTAAGGVDCVERILGAERVTCLGSAGIAIEGDRWDDYLALGADYQTDFHATRRSVAVVTTTDGVKNLHMDNPRSRARKYIVYAVNVTNLPDPVLDPDLGVETQRFPVLVAARNEGDSNSFVAIRNLSLSPLDYTNYLELDLDPALPAPRWMGFQLRSTRQTLRPSQTRDDMGNRDRYTDAQGNVNIGESGLRLPDQNDQETLSSQDHPFGLIQSKTATLELQEGLNYLLIEPVNVNRLVNQDDLRFDSGWQISELRIGPLDADLQGEVVRTCGVKRLHRGFAAAGGTVTVTLTARNVTGMTTIVETFPDGWDVADDGGGEVDPANNTLTFTTESDGSMTYVLNVADGLCEVAAIEGTIQGEGDFCDGPVFGDSSFIPVCVGDQGIAIGEAEFDRFVDIGTTGSVLPEIVTTADLRTSLWMPNAERREEKFILYAVNVTALPGDLPRYPIQIESRQIQGRVRSLGIRNLSIDDRPAVEQRSFIAVVLSERGGHHDGPRATDDINFSTQEFDLRGRIGRSGTRLNQAGRNNDTSVATNPEIREGFTDFILTENATLELQLGLNFLRIDATDPRRVQEGENHRPDSGWQAFEIRIGPNESGLQGEIVDACFVRRTVRATHFLPGGSVEVTLEPKNISGATTITETFPEGWGVADAAGGRVNGNILTLDVDTADPVSYVLNVPDDFCELATFSGVYSGAGDFCEGAVVGGREIPCAIACTDLNDVTGAVSEMLIIGPIDPGRNTQSVDGTCDDAGRLESADYLASADGRVSEENLAVRFGDELQPDFGGAADAIGVGLAPNLEINPRALEGILTVWIADANDNGRINFNDADNVGALDDFIIYSLVYLDNTTGGDLPVTLRVGSDDAVKVRLNGDLVHLNEECRGLPNIARSDRVLVTLRAGLNTLLIAVVDRGGNSDVRLLVYDEFDLAPLVAGTVVACLDPGEPTGGGEPEFVRGDADANGSINLTDGIVILNFLFLGAAAPACMDAADTDDDGGARPTLTDAVIVFAWLFSGGNPPREPTPGGPTYAAEDCGPDRTADAMDCARMAGICAN
ncbi:MAG: hypothetical protein O7J95_17375 [Planctomycetota bacterium]|nr:hypothetical protein [Planctomycetota bacterium]